MTARTTRGLRIATRCTSIDQFVAAFHRFCDAQTCFISTLTMRPVGLETAFSIDLADHVPALRGMGIVVEAWPTPGNRFGRPGLLLGIRKLSADSEKVFERLLAAHVAATPPPVTQVGSSLVVMLPLPKVMPDPSRTPGSELVLPANPLMNISDHSLKGFVDCTLYEETGTFFPVDDPAAASIDASAEPPRRVTIPPLSEAAMTTPIPMLTLQAPPPPARITPPPIPIARPTLTPELARMISPIAAMPTMTPPMTPMTPMAPMAPAPLALPPMSARRVARPWPKRRLAVAGGAALLTIVIALIAIGHSSSTPKAAAMPAPPNLVAANMPHARLARPTEPTPRAVAPVADVAPTAEPDDEAADTGAAPTFGTGPCKIAVATTPAGSIVAVDGEVAGPSPITIGGPCARRKLDIAHPRYQPTTRVVMATPTAAPVDIALARPTHDLFVESSPAGAVISIDGHRAGTTPTLVKIMGFTTLSLKIEKFGFKPMTQRIYSKSPRDHITVRMGH